MLDRRLVVATLLKDRKGLVVVSGLGSPTYDVGAAGDHDRNFYLWGAMAARPCWVWGSRSLSRMCRYQW